MQPKTLATPDLTPAQYLAAIAAIVGLAVSQGWIDNNRAQLITGIAAIVLPLILIAADAVIRHGRARAFSVPPKGEVLAGEPATSTRARTRTRKTAR